jgi:hypothetical protein
VTNTENMVEVGLEAVNCNKDNAIACASAAQRLADALADDAEKSYNGGYPAEGELLNRFAATMRFAALHAWNVHNQFLAYGR